MAAGKDIKAGGAYVELFTKNGKFDKGLKAASDKLKSWGEGLRSVGTKTMALSGAALGGLFGAAKVFDTMGSQLWDMSQRTGVSVEALSELKYAADQNSTSIDTLEGGLKKMQKALSHPSKAVTETIEGLGLSVEKLQAESPDQAFTDISEAIAKVQDPTAKAAAAMTIFGKSGTDLIPMMNELNDARQRARDLGLVMSTEDAKAADELGDRLGDLWSTMKMGTAMIGAALAPALTTAANWMAHAIATATQWIREHRGVVIVAGIAAAAVFAFGAALYAAGVAFTAFSYVITSVRVGIGAMTTLFSLATNPIVLIIAAIAALGVALVWLTGAGQAVASYLATVWDTIKNDATAAFGAISNALADGDIALAAQILWVSLKVEWQRGVNFLSGIWNTFTGWMTNGILTGFYAILRGWNWVSRSMSDTWIKTTAFVGGLWDAVKGTVIDAADEMAVGTQKAWNTAKDGSQAAGANAALDENLAKRKQGRAADELAAQQKRDAEKTAALAKNEADYNKFANNINEQQKTSSELVDKENAAKVAAGQAELDALIAKRTELAGKAQQEADAAQGVSDAADKLGQFKLPDELSPDRLQNGLSQAALSYSTAGTFNAAAAQSLRQAGNPLQKVEKYTAETAANTKKISEMDGLAFDD